MDQLHLILSYIIITSQFPLSVRCTTAGDQLHVAVMHTSIPYQLSLLPYTATTSVLSIFIKDQSHLVVMYSTKTDLFNVNVR